MPGHQHSIRRITRGLMAQELVDSPEAVGFEWTIQDKIAKDQDETTS